MVKFPQYRFELYRKIPSTESHSATAELLTGFTDLSYSGGIETTKDVMQIKIPNTRSGNGSYSMFLGKAARSDNYFGVDDEIRFYAYYNTPPSNIDDALILSGRIAGFKYAPNGTDMTYDIKIVNRTEELLNTMVPYSTRASTGSSNTAPSAIIQMVNRLNQFNRKKGVYAGLSNAPLTVNGQQITGSNGNVAATKLAGGAFPTLDYNETWKPVYYNIEKLSSPEYTEDDDAGEYIFYIKYTPVLPAFQATYGKTINELVWKPKSIVSSGSIREGIDIVRPNITLDTKEIQNILIVNAGTDRRGAGITGVAYDLTSVGKYGAKTGYYTGTRQVFSKIHALERDYVQNSLGKVIDADGMPAEGTGSYPINMTFKQRDSASGSFNGSTLTAASKKEWNQYLRDEARWQAIGYAQEIIKKLGEPKYRVEADMILGSNNIIPGDIYTFIVPSYGWEGTATNPGFQLRIRDMQHSWGDTGWTTRIVAEEDEKVISQKLGNTKNNV